MPAYLRLFAVLLFATSAAAVEIIAHRGASHDAPENTLAAMKLAWEQKADAIELDLHLSRDGQIVVMHDPDTKRTAGMSGKVADQDWAALAKLDVGVWKDAGFAGERVPTLMSILAGVGTGKRVFIEIKCGAEILPKLQEALASSKLPPARHHRLRPRNDGQDEKRSPGAQSVLVAQLERGLAGGNR